jgi:Tellurite resistance protein TerB.
MPKTLTNEEKMVLIAVMKYIVSTDGVITEREIDDINDLAEENGFEDFQKVFEEVDRTVKSLDDLKKLIKQVENEASMQNILKYAVEFSRADADINPRENEILKFMSNEWGISLNTFLDEE